MEEVRVDKTALLDKIRTNRETHRGVFEDALEGWRVQSVQLLERKVEQIKDGQTPDLTFREPAPEDHTVDYDRVIAMLEMSLDSEIMLPEHEFQCYVMDDWQWKRQWVLSNSKFSKSVGATYGN